MPRRLYGSLLTISALGIIVACGDDQPRVNPPTAPGTSAPLAVTAVAPATGGSNVSTSITIQGSGFQSGTSLTLGGVSTTVAFVNSTTLTAAAPPHAPGPIDVVVTNPNGESSRLAGGFTYISPPASLTLGGNFSLQAVGETSQLTATAVYPDGSTADVTRAVQWTSSFPAVATISQDGILTATGLGITVLGVRYSVTNPSLFRSVQVVVTPAGTFAASGRVREPGAGVIVDARVVHLASGESTLTNNGGNFFLGGLRGGSRFSFTKEGYEEVEADIVPDEFSDTPMQRVVRLAAGSPAYTSRLAPNDVEYLVGGSTRCQPCRLIRITGASGSTIQVKLTWTGPAPVQVWADGQVFEPGATPREVVADVRVTGGEARVFVGRVRTASPQDYISFSLVAATVSGFR
jgi:hypothetical protein